MQEKNDYYVYSHKRKDTGVVFYIGSGRTVRAYQSGQGKTKDWTDVASLSGGYEVVKLHENITRAEALDLEEHYIRNPDPLWKLVNKLLPLRANTTSKEKLSEKFYYDQASPSGLRWKENSYGNKGAVLKAKDSIAGNEHICNGKYPHWVLRVKIDGVAQSMQVHRIVWILTNGEIPAHLVIDHIDGNSLNNVVENLRIVTQSVNTKNRKIRRDNNTGLAGIRKVNNTYTASLCTASGRKIKTFPIKKYGEEMALYLAVKYRYDFLTQTKAGSEYSDNHVGMDNLIKIITDFEMSQGEYLGTYPTLV